MGLSNKRKFDEFFSNLQLNENTYLLALRCTLQKPTLFLKRKPCDIRTNWFSIHARCLWETNIDARYILNPCAAATYYTFYLTKVEKCLTKKMQSVLEKWKHEQTKAFEWIKKLGTTFLNAQQMFVQQSVHIIINSIISFNKIISIHKHMWRTW
jgi:hypothetical protein